MNGDNRAFDVNGIGDEQFIQTLRLAIDGGGVKAWAVVDTRKILVPSLVLLPWSQGTCHELPTSMTADEIFPMASRWLSDQWKTGKHEKEPDHDGSNGKGFRIYIEMWNKVGVYQACCAIRPEWIWYGK